MPMNRWVARAVDHVPAPLLLLVSSRTPPFATLRRTDRRTGRTRRTPVVAFRAPTGTERTVHVAVALTDGPDAPWVREVEDAGRCELVRGGFRYVLTGVRKVRADDEVTALPEQTRTLVHDLGVETLLTGRITPFADAPGQH
ncbi:hypothetical protein [Sanguibacter suaedae]|uniref:Nitroreductase family deazaflavin-dependent oxidoreductase n=1 Tax=Sanguibacter suaedae TaxID=2795737 RepID=A0A934I3Q3_9MICO|nr:hypothetical protein [Sanguibacter suaedae]MBI9115024.1 hypothetical protein [Sanguibacter suaedae]